HRSLDRGGQLGQLESARELVAMLDQANGAAPWQRRARDGRNPIVHDSLPETTLDGELRSVARVDIRTSRAAREVDDHVEQVTPGNPGAHSRASELVTGHRSHVALDLFEGASAALGDDLHVFGARAGEALEAGSLLDVGAYVQAHLVAPPARRDELEGDVEVGERVFESFQIASAAQHLEESRGSLIESRERRLGDFVL